MNENGARAEKTRKHVEKELDVIVCVGKKPKLVLIGCSHVMFNNTENLESSFTNHTGRRIATATNNLMHATRPKREATIREKEAGVNHVKALIWCHSMQSH